MRVRKLSHSVYQVQYHIVWGTKYRRKFLKHYVRKELVRSLYKIQRRYPSWYIHRVNTAVDHVHLLIEFPPKHSGSEVVRILKASTSRDLRHRFGFIGRMYDEGIGIWSVGYFISTVGLNESQIRKYIDKQNSYDRGVDLSSELS